jgi:hypothetical protein
MTTSKKKKSDEYKEGYEWAKRTESFFPYNPYMTSRPKAEDSQKANDWTEGYRAFMSTLK